ncbi:hypothetical protein BCR44DRAFT_1112121 [Catenaria anguillulae PL171]|uniref:Uncharacterized protein n=1 Tax=Catenaria anguillulae PL171 TaxID=765915 RepID=A0A1Y2H4B8_9FUNG|nr:hypothetical protein BCR44DRAFT_1112121 [Catenaria anguillulae PL171]
MSAAASPSTANAHLPSSPSASASISETSSSSAVSPSRHGPGHGSLSAGTGTSSRVASVHYHARTASSTSYATAPNGTVRSHVVRRSSGRSASNVSAALSTTNGATAGSVSASDNRVSFVASPESAGGNPGLNTIHSFASVNGTRQGSFVGSLPMVASGPFPHLILPEIDQGAELPMPKELENVRTNYCEVCAPIYYYGFQIHVYLVFNNDRPPIVM